MAACNFSIPISGDPQQILLKAKMALQSQGGHFNGDAEKGEFLVSVFGSTISGSYTMSAQNMDVIIDSKPMLVACGAIESFLKNQIAR